MKSVKIVVALITILMSQSVFANCPVKNHTANQIIECVVKEAGSSSYTDTLAKFDRCPSQIQKSERIIECTVNQADTENLVKNIIEQFERLKRLIDA